MSKHYNGFRPMTHKEPRLDPRIWVASNTDKEIVFVPTRLKKSGRERKRITCLKANSGCWEVNIQRYGYKQFQDGDISAPLHRIVYEYFVGQIPEGKVLMHSCDNPKCVNPEHLSPGEPWENIYDRTRKERSKRVLTAAQVNEIVELFDVHTHEEIGALYGVDGSTVSNIRTGRSWNAITGLREKPRFAARGKARTRTYVCKTKPADAESWS